MKRLLASVFFAGLLPLLTGCGATRAAHPQSSAAVEASPRTYVCHRALGPVEIDGVIDPGEWAGAVRVEMGDLVHGGPIENPPAFGMLYDDERLYAAFQIPDRNVWTTFTERDEPLWERDAVELFVDPNSNGLDYYEIEISPRNVVFDLFIINGRRLKRPRFSLAGWNSPGLKSEVAIDGELNSLKGTDRGWTVELSIPLAEFVSAPNVPPRPGDEWRFMAYVLNREPGAPPIFSTFSPAGEVSAHVPWRFAKLRFE